MAGRKCSVCSHPAINEINEMLINNVSFNEIVTLYTDLSKMSLSRHAKKHLPYTLTKAHSAAEIIHADNLLSQAQHLQQRAWNLLNQCESSGDLRAAVSALKALQGVLELYGKVSGELEPDRILLQIEPVINQLVLIVREELADNPQALERITHRLLQAGGDS